MPKSKEETASFISHSYSSPEYSRATGTEEPGETHISWSSYAEDISIYLSSIKDLQTSGWIVDKVLEKYQVIINHKKTETMISGYLDTNTSTSLTEHIKNDHENKTHLGCKSFNIRSQETSNLKYNNKMVHENKDERQYNL